MAQAMRPTGATSSIKAREEEKDVSFLIAAHAQRTELMYLYLTRSSKRHRLRSSAISDRTMAPEATGHHLLNPRAKEKVTERTEKEKATPARARTETKVERKERKERKEMVKEKTAPKEGRKAKEREKMKLPELSLPGGLMTKRMATISGRKTTARSLTIALRFAKAKAALHRARKVIVTLRRHNL